MDAASPPVGFSRYQKFMVGMLSFLQFGIFSRMIPAQALLSAVPVATQRGSFNAISASVQQFAGIEGTAHPAAAHQTALAALNSAPPQAGSAETEAALRALTD